MINKLKHANTTSWSYVLPAVSSRGQQPCHVQKTAFCNPPPSLWHLHSVSFPFHDIHWTFGGGRSWLIKMCHLGLSTQHSILPVMSLYINWYTRENFSYLILRKKKWKGKSSDRRIQWPFGKWRQYNESTFRIKFIVRILRPSSHFTLEHEKGFLVNRQ